MNWDDVFKIIFSTLASVGGTGGLIVIVIKFSSNIIADKLSQKYELKLNKELEKYKAGIENKIYISKTKFDTEFNIYRELSLNFANVVKAVQRLIPSGYALVTADKKERLKEEKRCYNILLEEATKAENSLYSNAPFISQKIYDKYAELLHLVRMQLGEYEERYNLFDLRPRNEKEKFSIDAYKRTSEIHSKWKILNTEIREYMATLDVMEEK